MSSYFEATQTETGVDMQQESRAKRGVRPAKAAERLGVSLPTFWRYARTIADFPKLIKLTDAVTIVDADELDAYVERRKIGTNPPRKIAAPEMKTRDAAASVGCRLVADLTPAELTAWTAAGKPGRVVLGECELVTIKAMRRLTTAPVLRAEPASAGRTRRKRAEEPAAI